MYNSNFTPTNPIVDGFLLCLMFFGPAIFGVVLAVIDYWK